MLPPVDRTVVSSDGTTIAVSEAGDGPAVVVVGGAFDHRGTNESRSKIAYNFPLP